VEGGGRVKHKQGRTRELQIARPYQTVFHALRVMQGQDISQLPVFEDDALIGTIYEDQILNLALQGKDLRKLVIREVMGKPLPTVPKDAPVERLTHLLSHESPALFVDMGGRQYEILTKYDLMGTIAGLVEMRK
ncbi:MAG: CBS domain-containing protein, partial [Acidobacteria bacterium]|nr:CBS domain-containing protein [Acidobacteriota bacterium]